jgi:glycosyltransferase involved in cell wall biosynthesis
MTMKILMVHNRYRERGGEDYSSAAEVGLLRSIGLDCIFHQVDNRDVQSFGASTAVNAVWSQSAARDVSKLIKDHQIDVVHVQNFFPQLSPSVHWAAKRAGAAVVQSLRNYRLACINGQFFRDGKICELCLGRSPVQGVIHRCYRDSFAGSSVAAAMLVTHRVIGTWTTQVDRFIAPSRFTRTKMIETGLPAEKIDVKPNFLEVIPAEPGTGTGGYFVYVGRLSKEKGIHTLVEAWRSMPPNGPGLKIVGTGPLDDFVKSAAETLPNVFAIGALAPEEVLKVLADAHALIFPSEWYETFGRVAMEAYSVGTPLIASDVGAVAEIVDDGITGFRFRAGSVADLASKVQQLVGDADRLKAMRSASRAAFLNRYTAAENEKLLLSTYRRAIESSSKARRPSP